MKISTRLTGTVLSLLAASVMAQCAPAIAAAKSPAPTSVAAQSWVTLKASTDQARYTPGQSIKVRLTATNTAKRGAYLRFTSGQRFDFSVFREGQTDTAYTWSAVRMFNQMVGSLWLKPRQSQSFDATIGDEVGALKPGKYILRAHLTNSPRNIAAPPIRFEIVNRGLAMTAQTDKTTYKIGEPVEISVAVANGATTAKHVLINSGLACDVIISDPTGNAIWTYGANLRFIRALGDVIWEKGETKTYAASWNGSPLPRNLPATALEPGRYQVQAVLQSTPPLYAPPVFIEITR